jgi:CheY-like chemotaxis protein
MAETSTGKIIAAVDDMFFAAKIRGAAAAIGVEVELASSRQQLEQQIASGRTLLLIVDLNSERLDPIGIIEDIKLRPDLKQIPVIGFLSHVQVELKRKAEDAGCDFVMPRSVFSQKLPEIISGSFPKKVAAIYEHNRRERQAGNN